MCVLTEGEGKWPASMCSGLVERYRRAGEAPPQVLYVDRDCCSAGGKGKAAAMFSEWDQLVVRLDVWHFMRRIAVGVTKDSHPLYAPFMGRLPACIFEWDAGDVERLKEACGYKLTAKELVRHSSHRTRGAQETKELVEQLFKDFVEATDTMGTRLFDKDRMQQRHINCIQDPPGRAALQKDGAGTSASDLHFQMYLIEGLVQWNEARAVAAVEGGSRRDICYGGQLQRYANMLSQQFMGLNLAEDYTALANYTAEDIQPPGLSSDTAKSSLPEPMREEPPPQIQGVQSNLAESSFPEPIDDPPTQSQMESLGPDGRPGYDHVIRLANSLVDLRHEGFITQQKVDEIVTLWDKLSEI
ncbi:hypothetical protein QQF64_031695 [Cirrhinus molitorella]|uniref:Uncharacterized protein n=1 Tax=Cirrhinus molitorella TaxID=172907 RepID=A0ABR3MXT5_9TELE